MHISKRPLNYSNSLYIPRLYQQQSQQSQDLLPDIYAPPSDASANTVASQNPLISTRSRAFTFSINRSGPGPGKYSRSPSIGHRNHDLTLSRNPAYSMGRAARDSGHDSGPTSYSSGPASYSPERHSITLIRNPSYSIGRAPRLLNRPSRYGPAGYEAGPGSYSPEKHSSPKHRSTPAFSIGRAKRFSDICFIQTTTD